MRNANVDDELEAFVSCDVFHVSDSDVLSNFDSNDQCDLELSDGEVNNSGIEGDVRKLYNPNMLEFEMPSNLSESITFQDGMVFADVHAFRNALVEYSIREGCKLDRVKNEKARITLRCAISDCKWRMHASPMADGTTYQIKSCFTSHNCVRIDGTKEASLMWMADKLIDLIKENPEIKPKGMRHELSKHGVAPEYMQLYRAKRKALEKVEGSHTESFSKLPTFAEMIFKTNPMSVVKFQYGDESETIPVAPTFKRMFMGLRALRDGFLDGCQPFIGFDGCHLKGPFGGVLLSVVGLDGNMGLYPLAFAVVEVESKDSWGFFFSCLEDMLGGFGDEKPWTFMTDRQKGLVETINETVPNAKNRKCCRHIYANLRLSYPGLLVKKLFWAASKAYCKAVFTKALDNLRTISPGAYEWLKKIEVSLWARHAFPMQLKNEHVTNNITESFNNWIGELRTKPILTLLDGIRSKLMGRIESRYQKGITWKSQVCESIISKLNATKDEAVKCTLLVGSQYEFQVREDHTHYIVNLMHWTCDCKVWDLTGIPCKHATLAIASKRQNIQAYTHSCYYKGNYLKAYNHKIKGIPDSMFWPSVDVNPSTILPPRIKRLPGRPKKNRKKEPGEQSKISRKRKTAVTKCGNCGGGGHNKRTCKIGGLQLDDETPLATFVDRRKRPRQAQEENHEA